MTHGHPPDYLKPPRELRGAHNRLAQTADLECWSSNAYVWFRAAARKPSIDWL